MEYCSIPSLTGSHKKIAFYICDQISFIFAIATDLNKLINSVILRSATFYKERRAKESKIELKM